MTDVSHLSIRRYNNSAFSAVIFVVICSLITDISLSNISDIISVSTSWGFAAFIAITIVYAVGQYFILEFLKRIKMKSPYFNKLTTTVTIVQFVLIAIIVFIILQMFVNSLYYSYMLIWSSSISYATASILMAILALMFFSWYRSNRTLIFLLYGISSTVISISTVSSLVFSSVILLSMPEEIRPQSQLGLEEKEVGHGPDIRKFDLSTTTLGIVQTLFTTSHIASFLLLWGSTALLLHTYSQKLGKVKFWTIISIPAASFLSIFVIVTPFVLTFSNNNSSSHAMEDTTFIIIVEVLGYTLPAIISSILFGLPFWIISRTLSYSSILKDYMIISASGLVLFGLATSGNLISASYPPFGLVSISFVGLSSYMILVGIYSSAISISADEKLRRSIRKTATEESKLLDSIGFAQMEQQIRKKIMHVTKVQSDNIMENSDAPTSLSEYEIEQYLDEVLQEIKARKEQEK
jgi:hypothetical protein